MIVHGNEINFNQLERKIYEYGCQIARGVMQQVMTALDDHLAKERDRKKYRDKGKRKTSIKTLMGEVEYSRRVYKYKSEAGVKGFIYLLDEAIELNKVGLFSGNLVQLITEAASNESFRKAAEDISKTTGQIISHGGAWNIIQAVGKKIETIEKRQAETVSKGSIPGQREKKILFEEADGVYLSIQGKDREKGKKQELKVAITYEGWKKVSKERYEVAHKLVCAGFEPAAEFIKRKEGMLGTEYNLDEIQMRILNGDGGSWIKKQSEEEGTHYQLDPFHKSRAVIRNIRDKEARQTALALIRENKYEEILMYLSALEKDTADQKHKKQIKDLYNYFKENQAGLMPYQARGLNLPALEEGLEYRTMGTMEHNICDVISQRMKHRKASWSIAGGGNMAKILAFKASRRLKDILKIFASTCASPKLVEVIQGTLSAAQVPEKIGKGYSYATRGAIPYERAAKTNGRSVILHLLAERAL
jgi:hypothetical protein